MAHALPEETILASEDPKPNPQLDSATDSAETVLDSHDSDHEAETAPAGSLLRNGEGSIDGAVTTEERSSMRMEDPDRAGRVWVCCPARGCGFRVSYIVGLFLTAFGCGITFTVVWVTVSVAEEVFEVSHKPYMFGKYIVEATGIVLAAVLYDRINKDLYFVISGSVLALSIAIAPVFPQFYALLGCTLVATAARSLATTGYLPRMLEICGSRCREASLQGILGMVHCGTFVANGLALWFVQNVGLSMKPHSWYMYLSRSRNISVKIENDVGEKLRYLGLISSAIIALAPFVFIGLFIRRGPSCRPHRDTEGENLQGRNNDTAAASRCWSIILTAMMLCVSFIFALLETMLFLFDRFPFGFYICTKFTSHPVAMLLSMKLPARYTILVDNMFIIVGFVLMYYVRSAFAFAVGAVGMGLGPCLPRLMIITSRCTRINGLVAALFAGVNVALRFAREGIMTSEWFPYLYIRKLVLYNERICMWLSFISLVILLCAVSILYRLRPPQQATQDGEREMITPGTCSRRHRTIPRL